MQCFKLDTMVGGWFVGDFEPSIWRHESHEVAVKYYQAGDREPSHVHRVAEEITVVVAGRVRMCGREFERGDIVVIKPGEATDFEAIEEATTVVVKSPSVRGDKYLTDDVESERPSAH